MTLKCFQIVVLASAIGLLGGWFLSPALANWIVAPLEGHSSPFSSDGIVADRALSSAGFALLFGLLAALVASRSPLRLSHWARLLLYGTLATATVVGLSCLIRFSLPDVGSIPQSPSRLDYLFVEAITVSGIPFGAVIVLAASWLIGQILWLVNAKTSRNTMAD